LNKILKIIQYMFYHSVILSLFKHTLLGSNSDESKVEALRLSYNSSSFVIDVQIIDSIS